eukprot:s1063_g9.t1
MGGHVEEETVMWNEQLMRVDATVGLCIQDGTQQPAEPEEGTLKKSDRSIAVELQQQAKLYLEGLLSFVEAAESNEIARAKSSAKRSGKARQAFSSEDGIASLLNDLFGRSQHSHHQSLWVADACPSALPTVPKRLRRTQGVLRLMQFILEIERTWLIRKTCTIYSALMLPTTESVSGLVNFRLRNPAMQLRLVALLEKCGSYADCHLAAKLMRILALENEWQHSISLVIAAGLAGRVLELLSPLTRRLGKGFELTATHLILAREAVRLVKAVAAAVGKLQFSRNLSVQKEALEAMTLALEIVMLLLYDMQVNAGIHGKELTKELALKTIRLQDVHSLCSETLAKLLHLAPSNRYEIVELMTQHKILGHQQAPPGVSRT